MSIKDLGNVVSRLEAVTSKLEKTRFGGGGGGTNDDTPLWFDDYMTMYDDKWTKFLNDTINLGGDLGKQGELLKNAFTAHTNVLKVASRFNKPAEKDLQVVLKPLSDGITAVQNFREKNRGSNQFYFLSALSEAIPFLGWVAVAPKPAAYILQMEESAQFYTNKILSVFRQSEPIKANWSISLIQLLKVFQQYVKDNHGTGLQWNKDKAAATPSCYSSIGSGSPAPSYSAAAPPPPPPPAGIPPPVPSITKSASAGEKPDTSALFSQINKGGDITRGLNKVTDDMKTHKNPELRSSTTAISPRPYSPPTFKKFNAPAGNTKKPEIVKKPAMLELQNKKWVVEHHDGNQSLIIDGIPEQTVYMYKCTNSVLQVKGKINSITLDSCKKCGVVFHDLISTCEFINCQSVKAQANGIVPTISIDKTDGIQVYVNEKSKKAQFITAKSSEMNICVQAEDGDLKETPIAEQFVTLWDGKVFKTDAMSLNL